MFLKQYYLGCLAHASYLIADERTKQAAVVDPQRDVGQYLRDAEANGFAIRYVILTHFHADFLAGHIELRNATGATIVLGRRAEAEFGFHAAADGETLDLGDVRLTVWETPGHTPEGISLLVDDATSGEAGPKAVLTGDTLFIGDVGRPDLLASVGVTADELASMLYRSLARLRELPDATLVYPAHGAGSMCGKNLSKETVSTIGEQKRFNYALQPMDEAAFKRIVTADQPEAPDYFIYDAVKNRQERPDLDATLTRSLRPLTPDDVLALAKAGAQVVDVREAADFEGAHLAGSLNVGLVGKYATWAGTMLSHDRPIVVIADPGAEAEAVMRLGRIGFDDVAGYLEGGMTALESRPELIRTTDRITAPALAERLAGPAPPTVLDVRSDGEFGKGHVAGAVNIPLPHLADRSGELPADRPVVVHCQGGYRSAIAASLLQRLGRPDVADLVGGYQTWMASGLPVEPPGEAAACSAGGACAT